MPTEDENSNNLIDKFLNGSLNDAERLQLDQGIAKDESLREELRFRIGMKNAAEEVWRNDSAREIRKLGRQQRWFKLRTVITLSLIAIVLLILTIWWLKL